MLVGLVLKTLPPAADNNTGGENCDETQSTRLWHGDTYVVYIERKALRRTAESGWDIESNLNISDLRKDV